MRRYEKTLVLISFLIISALFAGCSIKNPPQENSAKIKVLVTVVPETYYVKAVGGERVEVYVAVPPGADPHTFEPSARDMVKYSGADIYFALGEGLLPFEDQLVSRLSPMNPDMEVVETSPGIVILAGEAEQNGGNHDAGEVGHVHEGPDPHIWVSLKNAPVMTRHIYEALSRVDPGSEPYYRENRDAVLANITLMDREITLMLDKIPSRKFISAHGSWGYFARDYGLTQVIIEQSGKEPTAKDIETLINEAREEGSNIIVTEPEFSRKAADVISGSINGSVVMADPLASDIPDEIHNLAMALSRKGPV